MEFFNIGPGELLLVLIVALLVLGPKRLPEVGRSLGKGIREFRQATSALTEEFTQSLDEVKEPIRETTEMARQAVNVSQNPARPPNPSYGLKACPACSAYNPPTNKFCGACGTPLDSVEKSAEVTPRDQSS